MEDQQDVCVDRQSSPCYPGYFAACYKHYDTCVYSIDEHGHIYPCRNAAHLQLCKEHQCPTMFKCSQAYCIRYQDVCDGTTHCPNGEDETGCSVGTQRLCPGLYRCKDSNVCIHLAQLCNNIVDCPFGDDESLCDPQISPDGCVQYGRVSDCTNTNIKILPQLSASVEVMLFAGNFISIFPQLKYTHLKKFDISRNKLISLERNIFVFCNGMIHLNMSYNTIHILRKGVFTGVNILYELYIYGNPLRSIEPGGFSGLLALPALTITSISQLSNCILADLSSVENIQIVHTYIKVIDSETFCHMPHLEEVRFDDSPIEYVAGHPFELLPNLNKFHSDKSFVCCILPPNVQCMMQGVDHTKKCGHIITSKSATPVVWLCGVSIILLNVASLAFWSQQENKMSWIMLISALGLSDMLMGMYLLLIAAADVHYERVYSAYSLSIWRQSWLCGLAMFSTQLSFQMSLSVALLMNIDRLLLTKYAIRRWNLTVNGISSFLLLISLLISALSSGNIYIMLDNGQASSTLCMFASPFLRVRTIQWIIFAYNLCIFIALISTQLDNLLFLVTKHKMETQGKKKDMEQKLVLRISISIGMNIISYFICICMHANVLLGDSNRTDMFDIAQLACLVTNGIINPFINTFSKNMFVSSLHGLFKAR